MNTCINILCYEPNKIMIDFIKDMYKYFVEKKLNYSIYLTIDSDKKEYKSEEEYTVKLSGYNKIKREKNIKGKDNEFFFRFMYHDISLLYNHIKDKKLRSIKFDKNKYGPDALFTSILGI